LRCRRTRSAVKISAVPTTVTRCSYSRCAIHGYEAGTDRGSASEAPLSVQLSGAKRDVAFLSASSLRNARLWHEYASRLVLECVLPEKDMYPNIILAICHVFQTLLERPVAHCFSPLHRSHISSIMPSPFTCQRCLPSGVVCRMIPFEAQLTSLFNPRRIFV